MRKIKALPVKMETDISKDRNDMLCVLNDISSKIHFIGRHLTIWGSSQI